MRTLFILAVAWLAQASGALAQPLSSADVIISLPRYTPSARERLWRIADSEFGYVARFNRALAERLATCESISPAALATLRIAPGRFGPATAEAIQAARTCNVLGPGGGDVTYGDWLAVVGDSAPPTVFERAKAIAFQRSRFTPDYAHTLWDLDRRVFRESLFTWGPLHATLGEGCTIRRLLSQMRRREDLADSIAFAFAEEEQTLDAIQAARCDPPRSMENAIGPVYSDPERKQRFADAFAMLARDPRVRAIYDATLLGRSGPRATQLGLYYQLFSTAPAAPTEVDFGFILEHALLTLNDRRGWPRLEQLRTEAQAQRFRDNAAFRQWVARAYLDHSNAQGFWVSDEGTRSFLRGRIVAYYIDGVSQEGLSPEERRDWLTHSRTRAANVGLSDARAFRPCEFGEATPGCTPLFEAQGGE